MKLPPQCFTTKMTPSDGLKLELKVTEHCIQMEDNGFPLDVEECNKQITQLQERVDWVDKAVVHLIPPTPKQKGTVVEKLFKLNGSYTKQVTDWAEENDVPVEYVDGPFCRIDFIPINLDSHVQVNKWLLDNGWIPTEWNYKKDKRGKEIKDSQGNKIKTSPKITDDSMESLEELGQAGRLIAYRRKVTHKRNQIQGFIRNMRSDGRVPSRVNPLGAETRRMTHSIIANVPAPNKKGQFWKPMRKVFYSGDDQHVVVGADASQIQIRGLVHYAAVVAGDYSGIETMAEADSGRAKDFHDKNGETAGVTRQDSKGIFYGYLFGAGIPKTAKQLGKSVKATQAIRKKFDSAVPYVSKIVDHLVSFYRAHGYITGIDGGRIYVPSEHMLLVYLLQNFEAILMKVALCYAINDIKRYGWDAQLVTMQHDEFQFVCHKDNAKALAKSLERSIERAGVFIGSECPVKGEAVIGNNWYETH